MSIVTQDAERIAQLESELRSYKQSHALMQGQIQQLEQESNGLRVLLSEIYDIGDLREYLLDYIPEIEQAERQLTQHDKEVISNFVDRVNSKAWNGYNAIDVIDYIEQLQQGEE